MSRVRCLLCALFLVIVGVTSAVGLPQEPVEISTAAPVAADAVTPAPAPIVAVPAVEGHALDRALLEAGVEIAPGSSVYAGHQTRAPTRPTTSWSASPGSTG